MPERTDMSKLVITGASAPKKKLSRYFLIGAAAVVVSAGLAIGSAAWLCLRECRKPGSYRVAALRGRVVGRDLSIIQYKWLRRLFPGRRARLTLYKAGAPPEFRGALLTQTNADNLGSFDFGSLPPGKYELLVGLTTSDYGGQGFDFTVDPTAPHAQLLIDASQQGYCTCAGHDVELR